MIVNIDPIGEGDEASPQLFNERFAEITEALGGNLDSDNFKNRGVSREKIALDAVGPDELAAQSVLPSHMGNVWVGKTAGKSNVTTSYFDAFNKTIDLPEAAYVYMLWTAGGNGNTTTVSPEIQLLVNGVAVESFAGNTGLELYGAKTNADFTFAASGITSAMVSGTVNIKVQVKSQVANGWDLNGGFLRIDALSPESYLG